MKKRLRKKLHKGEYLELGCWFAFTFDTTDRDKLLDDWISVVEKHNCRTSCTMNERLVDGFLDCGLASDNPIEKRAAVQAWVKEHPEVQRSLFLSLEDVWGPLHESEDLRNSLTGWWEN